MVMIKMNKSIEEKTVRNSLHDIVSSIDDKVKLTFDFDMFEARRLLKLKIISTKRYNNN